MNSIRFQVHLSEDAIIQYARSIESPLQRIGGTLIAPSTMPTTFWKVADIPWLNRLEPPLIHGKQQFRYEAPITAGMDLDCCLFLTKVEHKAGRHAALTLYTNALICRCGDERIVAADTVLISVGDK